MTVCEVCGIAADSGVFDASNVFNVAIGSTPGISLEPGQEKVLAEYQLHPNYCGTLVYFAQFVVPGDVRTAGYQWQIRCNGQPRAPYLTFSHIVNPWGMAGFPINLRLEEGCLVELVIKNINTQPSQPEFLSQVGGRLMGRYWYNRIYGGAVG
jgi:hypothetical protein